MHSQSPSSFLRSSCDCLRSRSGGGGGAGGVGIEDGDAVAHAAGGESEHATELTAADDAYGLAWRDHGR